MSSTYCVEADVQNRFGTTNLDTYLNMDGSNTSAQKTARLNAGIAAIGGYIDSILQASQFSCAIPIIDPATSTTPGLITDVAAWLVGIWVYEANGVLDTDRDGRTLHKYAFRRDWCEKTLEDIRIGNKRITAIV